MRILFLSRWFPFPIDNGSKLRIWNILRGLSRQHEITLLSFADGEPNASDLSELQSFCEDVVTVPWRQYDPSSQRARLGLFSKTPRSYIDTFSQEMVKRIEQVLTVGEIDLIIASQWEMARYSEYFQGTRALFEEVELGIFYGQYVQAGSYGQRLRHGLTWMKHQNFLSRLLNDFQACTVVSEQEQRLLVKTVPGYEFAEVIPNCIDLASYAGIESRPQANSLVFTGSFRYEPNYDAMTWFLSDIYPQIRSEVPDARLTITGDHAGLPLPSTVGVIRTGFVPDVRPYIESAWASVVPLRSGGGTRLKILEAMAMRTPVITTSKGAEGLDVKNGHSVLIADEAEEISAAVVRLFKNPELRETLAENAYQVVSRDYDWEGVMPRFLQLIDDVVGATQRRKASVVSV